MISQHDLLILIGDIKEEMKGLLKCLVEVPMVNVEWTQPVSMISKSLDMEVMYPS